MFELWFCMKIPFMILMNIKKFWDANPTKNIKVEVVEMLFSPGNSRIPFPVGRYKWVYCYKLSKIITFVSQYLSLTIYTIHLRKKIILVILQVNT